MHLDENLIIFGDDFEDVYEFPLSQVGASETVIVEVGQSSPDWLTFLRNFPSGLQYKKRVDHFIEWQSQLIDDNDILFR